MKAKYGFTIKNYPRVISLVKSYDVDTKKKASIFSKEEIDCFVMSNELTTPYWLMRLIIVLLAYFGCLRHKETMDLVVENMVFEK